MKSILLLPLLFFVSFSSAQNLRVELLDDLGNPVSFATLNQKGNSKAYVADAEGELYYQLYTAQDTLEVRALGFQKTTFIIEADMKSPVVIVLKQDYNELSAVEVNGFSVNTFGFSQKTIAASSMFIDKKSLAKIESNNITQVLYSVPGVQIQQEDGFGLRPNIGMRGTGVERSSKITLMEDGILIAPAPYAASSAYYFPSMDHVESIEVLKGSSQIAYGPQTNGGAINLISDRIPDEFEVNAKVSLGSFLTRRVQASVGGSEENFGYLLKGTYFGSNGFKELPNGGNTGFGKSDVLAKLRFNTNSNAKIYQAFNIKYGYTQENTNETYLGITKDDFDINPLMRYAASANDNIKSTHSQIALSHLIKPTKNLSINTSIYLNKFQRNWFKLDKLAANGTTKVGIVDVLNDPTKYSAELDLMKGLDFDSSNRLYLRNNNRAYTSKGVQSNLYYSFKTKEVAHNINLGLRLHQDEMDRYQWDDTYTMTEEELLLVKAGTPGTESNRIEGAKAFATFLQYNLQYKRFSITPGIRYELMHFKKDDYGKEDTERTGSDLVISENKTHVFLPGVSVNYNVKGNNYLFAGAHKGFSPPNSNKETKAEESWNFELGAKGQSKGIGYEGVFFANRYQNLLGSDLSAAGGTGGTDLFNGGAVAVYGFESMIGYNILKKFSSDLKLPFTVTYTYTNAQFKSDFKSEGPWGTVAIGDRLPYISDHQLFVQLGLEHKRFDLNLMFKLLSAMRTSPSQGEFIADKSTPLFYQIDLLARFKVNKHLSVYTKLNNLTNNVQRVAKHPSGWRPNMPIYVEGGVQVQF